MSPRPIRRPNSPATSARKCACSPNSLTTPYCGANTGFEAAQWLAPAEGADATGATSPAAPESIALVALRPPGADNDANAFGLLVLGSPDTRRFHDGTGTDFLARIGSLASAALTRLLPH